MIYNLNIFYIDINLVDLIYQIPDINSYNMEG